MSIPEELLVAEADQLPTPALVIFAAIAENNVRLLTEMAGGTHRLMPHVKTCKSSEAVQLMRNAGIDRFKCATIAEAEMLALSGAREVLLAYQPVGKNMARFARLCRQFPGSSIACLVDHPLVLEQLETTAAREGTVFNLFIDIDVGMHRTGLPAAAAPALAWQAEQAVHLKLLGLHAYDGHIHQANQEARRLAWTEAFDPVFRLLSELEEEIARPIALVAGGTPTFPYHLQDERVTCSPGTFIYWDAGYAEQYPEQPFQPAAWLLGRVVSLPAPGRLCLDIGHKAVAAEMELEMRLRFPFNPSFRIAGQSEEHLMIETDETDQYAPGELIYALPWHICPTVALHEEATIIKNGKRAGSWAATARKRTITI
ncbi:threonine aldolase [Pedobacter yulinensis]|uniref:Threonine aldolase n=1 Tax=Pedobacter yulinensis TaxID=2126353 RepID=A0A2T3HMC3_9SPHI|nr:D-TA family PLP-dependent enzyme [Pedobacter yulinensis]PST83608.1 threonine aldolase [Pedobacter yulinensis]